MLPLWMVKRAAAIWLMALARQWMLLQWPVGGSKCTGFERRRKDLLSALLPFFKTEKLCYIKTKANLRGYIRYFFLIEWPHSSIYGT